MEVQLEVFEEILKQTNKNYHMLDIDKFVVDEKLFQLLIFYDSNLTVIREYEKDGKKKEYDYMLSDSEYTILMGEYGKNKDFAIICYPTKEIQKELKQSPVVEKEEFGDEIANYVKYPVSLIVSKLFQEQSDGYKGYMVIESIEPLKYKIIKGFEFLKEGENMAKKDVVVVKEEKKDLANLTKDQIELLKRTVAKGATDDEFKIFLALAQKYDLDPFAKQIWFVKYKESEPASIFTGRDGFLHIAHRTGKFDGMETQVRKVDEPLRVYDKYGKLIFKSDYQYVATCKVYRKDMKHPIVVEVWEEEYSAGNRMWKTKRRTMIQKVAESQALRRAFDISGLYAPEEISEVAYVDHGDYEPDEITEVKEKVKQENPEDEVLTKLKNIVGEENAEEVEGEIEGTPEDEIEDLFEEENNAEDIVDTIIDNNKATDTQIKKLYAVVNQIAKLKGSSKDKAIEKIKKQFKVEHLHDISKKDMWELIDGLEKTLKKIQNKLGSES